MAYFVNKVSFNQANQYNILFRITLLYFYCLDLEIVQPAFSSTVRGYSSFIAYRLPLTSIQHTFELRLKFIPETMEQISLMVFIGQESVHGSNSDYLSLSFIKGYIALTWNLGAGRIF